MLCNRSCSLSQTSSMPVTNVKTTALADSDGILSDSSSSTKVASDDHDVALRDVKSVLDAQRDVLQEKDNGRDYAAQVFWWLLAFRILNASVMQTYFQPDEFFQALEPAWQIAFGAESGAWITWEWRNAMRSTIPPFMYGGLYWLCDRVATYFSLAAASRGDLLMAAPKTLQACIAAVGDYYTWKLGELAYGDGQAGHWFTLILTIANPFHFFVVTRTFSNCLELSLNAAALYLWFTSAPEDPTLIEVGDESSGGNRDRTLSGSWISTKLEESTHKVKDFVVKQVRAYDLNRLRLCLVLAAVGCILRITNALTWIALVSFEFFEYEATWYQLFARSGGKGKLSVPLIIPKLRELNNAHAVLVREAVICGSAVIAVSVYLDKQYYGEWTLPMAQFLYVNVGEGISSFYGTQDVVFYFTQGLPLLAGVFTPFAVLQIYHYLVRADRIDDDFQGIIKYEFAAITIFVPLIFSFVAHKETRFVYPLVPILHVLAAGPAADYFQPLFQRKLFSSTSRKHITRFAVASSILVINILVAIILSLFHQRAPIAVMDYLRHEHEAHYLSQPPAATGIATADTSMTVGFLMPCHSTPWRSHLVHPGIKAWALGCEPPLGLSTAEKAVYRDEADQFYDDPEAFLKRTLGKPKRAKKGGWGWNYTYEGFGAHGKEKGLAWDGKPGAKMWPEYLVFFAEKEELLARVLDGTDYVQCQRLWNTWWHDDWRRRGDMVVWCLREKPLDIAELDGVMAQKLTRKMKKKNAAAGQ